ncbi:hypothetical protein AMS68_004842 [Peltaster fructicola]|uniref:Aquaporin n=1 Tax=Peltaster fructicola TaxID=286661 RepID=A0A6H0XXD7_9PEZI|nr:hypothetical protein AMS68_004842 [Peltaster fructicola]
MATLHTTQPDAVHVHTTDGGQDWSMNAANPQADTIVAFPGRHRAADMAPIEEGQGTLLPGARRKAPSPARQHAIAFLGELVGTFLFLFFAFSATEVANRRAPSSGADAATLLYISLAFGFSLAVNAWVFFRISGGLFNPAVTLGLMLIGSLSYFRAAIVFVAQILGAMAAAGVVTGLFPGRFLAASDLAPDTSVVRGLFIEMLLTAELVFTIFMLAAEKHRATFLAPVGIGLALFIAEMVGVLYTGGSLNPARSFAPCVVQAYFPTYHWIYWVGPILGALLAVLFYRFVKALEYEVNGAAGQDDDHLALDHDPRQGSYQTATSGGTTQRLI